MRIRQFREDHWDRLPTIRLQKAVLDNFKSVENGFTGFSDRKDFSSCTLPATFTSSFKYTPLGQRHDNSFDICDMCAYICVRIGGYGDTCIQVTDAKEETSVE